MWERTWVDLWYATNGFQIIYIYTYLYSHPAVDRIYEYKYIYIYIYEYGRVKHLHDNEMIFETYHILSTAGLSYTIELLIISHLSGFKSQWIVILLSQLPIIYISRGSKLGWEWPRTWLVVSRIWSNVWDPRFDAQESQGGPRQIDEWSQLTFESICGFNPGLTLTDSQEGFLQRVGICNENGTPPSQFMSPGGYSCGVDTSYKLVYNPIEL